MTDGDEMRQWGGGEGGGSGGRRQRREFIVYFVPAAAAAAQHEKWTPTRRVQQISNCELFNWLDLDATRTTHSFIHTRWWLSSPSTSTWARAIASVRAPRHNAQLEGTVI